MSSRSPRSQSRTASRVSEPEDSYPHIPEPKQGQAGALLAFLSVLAVLGFGTWSAIGTLAGSNDKPAAKPAATSGPTQVAATAPTVAATAAPTTAATAAAAAPTAAPGGNRVHTVVSGDTLYGIAQRYRTTVEAIMAANGITDRGKTLHVGDKLTIP